MIDRHRRLAVPVGIVLLLATTACHVGGDDKGQEVAASGSGTARSYAASNFNEVALRGSDNVDVRVGGGFSVRAEGNAEELDKLRIALDGDTLLIGRKRGHGMSWSDGDPVKIFVTLPRLAEADVLGSGDMAVDRVEGSRFEAAIAGSGTLALAALAVDEAEVSIAGSGDAQIAGQARQLKVNIAGSGNFRGTGLRATAADISVAGSGDVTAQVVGDAKVSVMGSGDVDLGPEARCQTSKMGSGDVRCGR